jgi:precorrin-6Y C5,15-methyltransferase (decarboxylating) CbiT subunit
MKQYFLGIDDEEFQRGSVPMTKREIRILTIAAAQIGAGDIVYDIGAGTGSLSIEAARQAPKGRVYALERKPEAAALIRKNAERFAVHNLEIIAAEAPAGLDALPCCQAAIIGGSGGNLAAILDALREKLLPKGRMVLNCITMQTVATALAYLRQAEEFSYEAVQVQVNRLRQVGDYDMAKAGKSHLYHHGNQKGLVPCCYG